MHARKESAPDSQGSQPRPKARLSLPFPFKRHEGNGDSVSERLHWKPSRARSGVRRSAHDRSGARTQPWTPTNPESRTTLTCTSLTDPGEVDPPFGMGLGGAVSRNRSQMNGYRQSGNLSHHVKRNQEIQQNGTHSLLPTNCLRRIFTAYLDILGVKLVKDLQRLLVAPGDFGIGVLLRLARFREVLRRSKKRAS